MLSTLQWYFLAVLPAGLLSLVAIAAPDRRSWKVIALGLTATFLPISYLAASDLLSRPKPLQQELLQAQLKEAVVLSSLIRDGEDIFIWLQVQGVPEPRSYRLPWNEDTAVQLHRAQSEAEEQGAETTMTLPEGETMDNAAPVFQVKAPPKLPPKDTQQ
ncbi:MAG: hypothetical protein KTR32_04405 [Granulosicoccus sp.]|nr:hypothetical protein [Granulosicoccus sp.]